MSSDIAIYIQNIVPASWLHNNAFVSVNYRCYYFDYTKRFILITIIEFSIV